MLSRLKNDRVFPWVFAAVIVALLYGWWPYQSGTYKQRSSVAAGLFQLIKLDAEWVFCPAVPLIVGWFVWKNREELARLEIRPSPWGLVLILFALLLFWAGYKADTRYIGYLSAQVLTASLILWFGGEKWMRALAFPWLFLIFTWPMIPLENIISPKLRMLTTMLTSGFMNLIGMANTRVGTSIFSAGDAAHGLMQGAKFSLDVDAPCSGIRSLFALLMITALFGYLILTKASHRVSLFFSAIPFALLGNFVRMMLLAVCSQLFGMDFAVGRTVDGHLQMSTFHTMAGFFGFGLALAGMLLLCRFFEGKDAFSMDRMLGPLSPHGAEPEAVPQASPRRGAVFFLQMAWPLAATVAVLVICHFTPVSPISAPGLTLDLPAQFEDYTSHPMEMSTQEKNVFEEGVDLSRCLYYAPNGRNVLCTVVRSGPVLRSLHKPEVCLPAQNWNIADTRIQSLTMSDGRPLEIAILNVFRERRDEKGQRLRLRGVNVYWYAGLDRQTASYPWHVCLSHWDNIMRNINHRWCMASFFLTLPEAPADQVDAMQEMMAEETLKRFVGNFAPLIIVQGNALEK